MAKLVLDGGDPDRALSTAYYAMFYAARVALIHVGQPERAMGKTHSGMISAFNQFVVHAGLVDSGLGKAFSLELNRRIFADYEEGGVSVAEAAQAIVIATDFVETVTGLMGASGIAIVGDEIENETLHCSDRFAVDGCGCRSGRLLVRRESCG